MKKYIFIYIFLFALLLLALLFNHYKQKPESADDLPVASISPDTLTTAPQLTRIHSSIHYGETLSTIFRKHGFDQSTNYAMCTEFQKVYNIRHLKPHQEYIIERDSSDSRIRFIFKPTIEEQYIITFNNDSVSSQSSEIELIKRIRRLKGTVTTSLYDAILAAHETPELLVAFTDIFQWDVDFFIDPRVGDEFKIVFEAYYLPDDTTATESLNDRFVRYGRILAAQYTLQGELLSAIYFDNHPKDDGYYSLDGESFQKTFLKSPLNYRRISSYFSLARRHPILKKVRAHTGIDYAAPTGTPVSASANGVIIKMAYGRQIGRYIKIRHKNPRYVTLYGHLSKFAQGMHVGKQVKQRDVIGYVGMTGLATGPHLHYTFYDNGKPINPLKIKNTSGDPISTENLPRYQHVRDEMLAQLAKLDRILQPVYQIPALAVRYNRYGCIDR